LFVGMASKACTLAMAQDLKPSPEANVCLTASPEHSVILINAEGETATPARPDDRVQQALSEPAPASVPTAPAADQQPSEAPLVTKWQDDDLDGCRVSVNNACPTVYGQVEALFLMREPRFTEQPLVVNDTTNTTLLSTSDLDFDFEPGVRATAGMRLCGGRALEFTYFGLWQDDASAAIVAPNDEAYLIFPDNLVGNVFVDMDETHVDYSSWVHSFELNAPCCYGCCDQCDSGKGGDKGKGCGEGGCGDVHCQSFEWFGGFRYLNLDEELNILAQRIQNGGVEEGSYNLRTANHLYGAQLGARLRRSWSVFGWEATGKAGIFGNDAQTNQSVTDFPDYQLPGRTAWSRNGTVAFLGEVNLSALCRLTDVWNLRAGYNAIWIEGVALAPDQLDFNFAAAPRTIDNGGGMFLHGVNLGLEARW